MYSVYYHEFFIHYRHRIASVRIMNCMALRMLAIKHIQLLSIFYVERKMEYMHD
jgi:hypothetical protein